MHVIRTYLEMLDEAAHRSAGPFSVGERAVREDPYPPERYRLLYSGVGHAHNWRDRLVWSDAELVAHLARREIEVWTVFVGHQPAGFFELLQEERAVEVAYFGLLPDFHGRGLGKRTLSAAIDRAWALAAARVWLHTCTLDKPTALPNYLARGFVPFRTEEYEVEL